MQQPEQEEEGDFAQEHQTAGFKASLPLAVGATDAGGPLEGLDPDHRRDRYPPTWHGFKLAAHSAWRRLRHP